MQNNRDIALALSRVSARYADQHDELALENISFVVPAGAFVSIAGPSGAGKSTLLRVILGLLPAASGVITRNYQRAGMVFQNYALFPWLSALDNAAFGLKMSGVSTHERERIARETLKDLGLASFERHYPGELSGGQRQRVGLARALAINPDLLILDEPFSNLDTITSESLKTDLLRIWQKQRMSILMVNHLLPDAVELSDSVIVMKANPGSTERALTIDLPRPRDTRDGKFYRYVDQLTEAVRAVS